MVVRAGKNLGADTSGGKKGGSGGKRETEEKLVRCSKKNRGSEIPQEPASRLRGAKVAPEKQTEDRCEKSLRAEDPESIAVWGKKKTLGQ